MTRVGGAPADRAQRAEPRRFDRFSLGMYAAFLLWNWLLYAFGPVVQLLGSDLGMSGTEVGLHGVALAVGTASSGVVLPTVVSALGRRGSLIAGAVLVAAGAVALTAFSTLAATLTATVVLALGGNLAIAAAQAGLVVHHGAGAAVPVATANGVGTLIGLFGPLVVGASVAAGPGWRPVVLATVVLAAVVVALWSTVPTTAAMTPRRGHRPERPASTATRRAHGRGWSLPTTGWWFLVAALIGVAIENATTFWSLTLIAERTGAGAGVAAGATAAFVGGMACSRLSSGWVTSRVTAPVAVGVAFGVNAAGWAVLWSATVPVLAVLGLAVSGVGCGLLYPLAASLMLATTRGGTDAAQGLLMVAIGVAVGVVPFALGVLADAVGVRTAFVLIPVLAALGVVATLVAIRGSTEGRRAG